MENLIQKELYNNAKKIMTSKSKYAPSYDIKRNEALEYFNQLGIPTKKDENWVYTNIAKNLSPRFSSESNDKDFPKELVINKLAILVFNNGHFNRSQSKMPEGMTKTSPEIPQQFHDVFDALNLVVASDAISFSISKSTNIEIPITILHLVDEDGVNKQISPRINFNIDENCTLSVVEVFSCTHPDLFQYTTNAHTSFKLGKNSNVKHVKLNLEAKLSTHIGFTHAEVQRDANFETYLIDLGNFVSRNNIDVHLINENAKTGVHGLFNLKEAEHSDTFSNIYHHSPNTFSDQLYKGILNDQSNGAFTGKIIIDTGAFGVNSSQLNKNLLLSKKAHINTRPQLLVSADDVKCSHGATVGELSSDEEFYLMSRGISKIKARKMLAIGFAHEILLKINNKEIFNFLNNFLEKSEFEV